jgi:hypothetical protein
MINETPPLVTPAQTLAPSLHDDSSFEKRNIVKETEHYVYIDWEQDDTHHPFNWTLKRRWANTFVALLFNAVTAFNATGYSAGVRQGSMELHTSRLMWLTGMTAVSIIASIDRGAF